MKMIMKLYMIAGIVLLAIVCVFILCVGAGMLLKYGNPYVIKDNKEAVCQIEEKAFGECIGSLRYVKGFMRHWQETSVIVKFEVCDYGRSWMTISNKLCHARSYSEVWSRENGGSSARPFIPFAKHLMSPQEIMLKEFKNRDATLILSTDENGHYFIYAEGPFITSEMFDNVIDDRLSILLALKRMLGRED